MKSKHCEKCQSTAFFQIMEASVVIITPSDLSSSFVVPLADYLNFIVYQNDKNWMTCLLFSRYCGESHGTYA